MLDNGFTPTPTLPLKGEGIRGSLRRSDQDLGSRFRVHRSGVKTFEPLNPEPHNPDRPDVQFLSKVLKTMGIAVTK